MFVSIVRGVSALRSVYSSIRDPFVPSDTPAITSHTGVNNHGDSYRWRHSTAYRVGVAMERVDGSIGVRMALATALVGVILLSVAGASVSARPPPQAVCGACSDTLVETAADSGVDISIVASSLFVRIDESGTGHWTARVRLTGRGVDPLRENHSLRDHIVKQVHDRGYVAIEEPRSLTTSMNGETLIVEYEVPGMAHESVGGVSVVDFFYWHGGEARWFYLAADSMTMQGPPGTVVSHAPADATTADHAVTWEGSDEQYDPLGVRSHVVFAPDDGVVSSVATTLGIGIDVAQLKAQDLVAAAAPLAILAVVVALLWRFESRLTELSRSQLIALVVGPLAAVGLTAATVETLVGAPDPVTDQLGDFLFYLIVVVAATGAGPALALGGPLVVGQILLARRLLEGESGTTNSRETITRLLLRPTAVVLAGQWLFFPAAAAGAAGDDAVYGLVSLVLPPLYFVPLALTRQGETPLRLAFVAGLLFSPIPVVVGLAPHTATTLVSGPLALRYVPWGLAVAAMGLLAYVAGSRLVAPERARTG